MHLNKVGFPFNETIKWVFLMVNQEYNGNLLTFNNEMCYTIGKRGEIG